MIECLKWCLEQPLFSSVLEKGFSKHLNSLRLDIRKGALGSLCTWNQHLPPTSRKQVIILDIYKTFQNMNVAQHPALLNVFLKQRLLATY